METSSCCIWIFAASIGKRNLRLSVDKGSITLLLSTHLKGFLLKMDLPVALHTWFFFFFFNLEAATVRPGIFPDEIWNRLWGGIDRVFSGIRNDDASLSGSPPRDSREGEEEEEAAEGLGGVTGSRDTRQRQSRRPEAWEKWVKTRNRRMVIGRI